MGWVTADFKLMPAGLTAVDTMDVTTQAFPVILRTKIPFLSEASLPTESSWAITVVQWEQ